MSINSEKYYQFIDEYFEGTICADDMIDFSKRLKEDPDLRKEFHLRKELQEAIGDKDFDNVNRMVNDIINERNSNGRILPILKGAKATTQSFVRVAAIFVALVAIIAFVNLMMPNHNPYQIVEANFEPYETYASFRSDDSNESLMKAASTLYDGEQYVAAIEVFKQLPVSYRSNFYIANAYIATNRYGEAIGLLQPITNNSTLYSDAANWYLALAYFGNQQPKEAKNILEGISSSDSFYKAQADKVLADL